MTRRLSEIFLSTKAIARPGTSECSAATAAAKNSGGKEAASSSTCGRGRGGRGAATDRPSGSARRGGGTSSRWCVYLIVSTRLPRTYVGVTTNFPRRLKQHNGELRGGAKASCAGRPWIGACIVRGFTDKSEGFQFEAKWKSISRKLPRKNKKDDDDLKNKKDDDDLNKLLLHRKAALGRVMDSLDCCHLHVDWVAGPS